MNPKQQAAEAAVAYLRNDMIIGLGTGSTADLFLQKLGAQIKAGLLSGIRGVPTSRQSQRRAEHLGIPLVPNGQCPQTDLTIDGADEIAPNLDLIKGLGGALLREKIVAQNSRQLIIIADSSKVVDVLGSKAPLPVEVAIFAHEAHVPFLRDLGSEPVLRTDEQGRIFTTDNGNYIYDCRFPSIPKPHDLEARLQSRAGIIATGLFLGMASIALIGGDGKVRTMKRPA